MDLHFPLRNKNISEIHLIDSIIIIITVIATMVNFIKYSSHFLQFFDIIKIMNYIIPELKLK